MSRETKKKKNASTPSQKKKWKKIWNQSIYTFKNEKLNKEIIEKKIHIKNWVFLSLKLKCRKNCDEPICTVKFNQIKTKKELFIGARLRHWAIIVITIRFTFPFFFSHRIFLSVHIVSFIIITLQHHLHPTTWVSKIYYYSV